MFEASLHWQVERSPAYLMIGDSEVKDLQPGVSPGMLAVRVAIETPYPASGAARAVVTNLLNTALILTEWATESEV
jgi:hypothetical protein